jgi:aldehyde:ferredoxin oxidoreductase
MTKYVGASGFGSRILYDEVGPEVEAMTPENRLIIAAGPLTGTLAPSASRCELTTKSPLTGILGRANTGGTFGATMKLAGYDVIVIRGRSEKPVYIWLDDDDVEIRDASHLWGQDVWKTHHAIDHAHQARKITDGRYLNEVATLTIGPAGENLSMAACVMDGVAHAAGIGGIGAVWGYKRLKGVAVRGTRGVNIEKPKEFIDLAHTLWGRSKKDPMWPSTHKWGTMAWVGGSYSRSKVARVFVRGSRNEAIEEKGFEPIVEGSRGCHGCAIGCDHFLNVKEGKYKGTKGEGVEGFVQIYALSFRTMSAPFLAAYNNLCNRLGMNVSSVGSAVVWAMELWRAGIINEADTGGIEVTEGNQEAILELMEKMAHREGFGDILSDYPARAAEKLGKDSDLYAAHTKGQFAWVPSHGIGTTLIYTLGLNTATRGYDHLTGCLSILTKEFRAEPMFGITEDLLTKLGQERYGDPKVFTEPWEFNPKTVQAEYDFENLLYLCDLIGMCKFATRYNLPVTGLCIEDMADLLTTVTGELFTGEDLDLAARRVFALERAYNAREGMRRIDDYPFFLRWKMERGEPHPIYKEDQVRVNAENYAAVLDEWYGLRGYDVKTGIPSGEELKKLGLEDVAADLEERNIMQ